MHTFEVWAPTAEAVDVVLGERRLAMSPGRGGWWHAEAPEAGHGTDYAFAVNGGNAYPDPRSRWQPQGIHGRSRVFDSRSFAWTDHGWQAPPLPSAVIYEMHVGTWTAEGTFASAIERLDHLVELGVTHLELMPVNEFSGAWGWGYDGVDLFAAHHAYGGPEGLMRLVDAAHRKGLAVLLDVVYNHFGPAGNYLSNFGPYFTSRHKTPWGDAVNLDGPHCDEVRRFFCDNALMWLRDFHFDGLRIDAVHALIDNGAYHFLEQLALEVEKLSVSVGRHLVLIAESDLNDPRIVRPREMGGYGMDAQWSDDFHHALHSVVTGETAGYYADFGGLDKLAKALKCAFVYDGLYSQHRKRPHGRAIRMLPGYSFLGYIQNHDQIGNRAAGDRVSHLTSFRKAKMAAGLVLTSPFVPMLFQGEEWAASTPFQYFTQHEDEELGKAVSEGRRSEFVDFGWDPAQVPDPQARSTFEASKLRWEEIRQGEHAEMLEWHRQLIALRRNLPSLNDGDLENVQVQFDNAAGWLAVTRGKVAVACNFSEGTQCVPVSAGHRVLLASTPEAEICEGGVRLGAETLAVVEGT